MMGPRCHWSSKRMDLPRATNKGSQKQWPVTRQRVAHPSLACPIAVHLHDMFLQQSNAETGVRRPAAGLQKG